MAVLAALCYIAGGVQFYRDRQMRLAAPSSPTSQSSALPGRKISHRYAREMGSAWPVGINRAIGECIVAAQDLVAERGVRGDDWFSRDLRGWIVETDDLLDCAEAGDLLLAFCADSVQPPEGVAEQVAYLDRQTALLRDAFKRLRS